MLTSRLVNNLYLLCRNSRIHDKISTLGINWFPFHRQRSSVSLGIKLHVLCKILETPWPNYSALLACDIKIKTGENYLRRGKLGIDLITLGLVLIELLRPTYLVEVVNQGLSGRNRCRTVKPEERVASGCNILFQDI